MKALKIILGLLLATSIVVIIAAFLFISPRVETFPSEPVPGDLLSDTRFQSAIKASGAILKSAREAHHLPSLSAAVGVNGQLVWAASTGYASVADEEPISSAHRYRIGGISKSLTAVALARLVEAEKTTFDTDFYELVPDYPQKAHAFTLRQLASHTAGIRHYRDFPMSLSESNHQQQYDDISSALVLVKDDELRFQPGTAFLYSSYGYNILSRALEVAADKSFLEFMHSAVFAPLKMKSTQADHQDREVSKVATPYLLYDDVIIKAPSVNNSYKWAGDGFLSTPRDLVSFGNGLIADKILTRATRETLWTPQSLADGSMNPQRYALGFRIKQLENEEFRQVSHGGSSAGGTSFFAIYPEETLVIAIMTNTSLLADGINLAQYAEDIINEFRSVLPPRPAPEETE